MNNKLTRNPPTAEQIRSVYRVVEDNELWHRIEALMNGKRVTPRIRDYVSRQLMIYARLHCTRADKTSVTVAQTQIVEETEKFLDCLERFRTSERPEYREVWMRFGLSTTFTDYTFDKNGHTVTPVSEVELALSDHLNSMKLRYPAKLGKPPKNREKIFLDFHLAFQAIGGRPTSNWYNLKNENTGKFVEFVTLILGACPNFLAAELGTGLASALRTQLRAWRRVPTADGAPESSFALATLKYLRAGSQVMLRRRVTTGGPIGTRPDLLGGTLISPKRSRKKNRSGSPQ